MPYPHITSVNSGAIFAMLVNDEIANVSICTPVYSDGPGSFKMALGDGSAKSKVVGIVIDQVVTPTKLGSVLNAGIVSAQSSQWDAVCGTSGGLLFGTLYYLSTTVPGTLTTISASNVPVIFGLGPTMGAIATASSSGSKSGSVLPSFALMDDDIVAAASGIVLAIPPSPSAAKSALGFGGRFTTYVVPAACKLGNVEVSQVGWQSFAINAGTITIKCTVNGVPNAATVVINNASAQVVTSANFVGITLAAGDLLGFTADCSGSLDASGLLCLTIIPTVTG